VAGIDVETRFAEIRGTMKPTTDKHKTALKLKTNTKTKKKLQKRSPERS